MNRNRRTTSGHTRLSRQRPIVLLVLAAVLLPLFVACQTVAATGQRRLNLVGERQEIELGREYDASVVATIGEYRDESLNAYVHELGTRIAETTERPHLPWTFRVIEDTAVNAFAVPGGFVYVTRGILPYFENETELIGVLAHEVAHITAMHSVVRLSRLQFGQLGLGLLSALDPENGVLLAVSQLGLEALFLRHSRTDELQADELGVRYMAGVGADPRVLGDVMTMLEDVSRIRGASTLPEWWSTHPTPANRRAAIESHARRLDPATYAPPDREGFLARLDGLIFGENPREGVVYADFYYHPDLRFYFRIPDRWAVINRKDVVLALSPGRDAIVQLSISGEDSADAAMRRFYADPAVSGQYRHVGAPHGVPSVRGEFSATVGADYLRGEIVYAEYGGRVYQILGYANDRDWSTHEASVRRSTGSFAPLTEAGGALHREILQLQPQRVSIVTPTSTMVASEVHRRYSSDIPLREFLLLNRLREDSVVQAGSSVKAVVGSVLR